MSDNDTLLIKPVYTSITQGKPVDIIVYSINFNVYDSIKIPWQYIFFKKKYGIRYILFTDNQNLKSQFWEIAYCNINGLDPRRASRHLKINSHLLPPHNISVYIDASVRFKIQKLKKFVVHNLQETNIAIFRHNNTDCLYNEAYKCIRLGLDSSKNILSQIGKYKQEGFPEKFGLSENGCILRRNTDDVIALNKLWWQEYIFGSTRDQISFMYSIWKTKTVFAYISGSIWNNPLLKVKQHLKSRQIIDTNTPNSIGTILKLQLLLFTDKQVGRIGIIIKHMSPRAHRALKAKLSLR